MTRTRKFTWDPESGERVLAGLDEQVTSDPEKVMGDIIADPEMDDPEPLDVRIARCLKANGSAVSAALAALYAEAEIALATSRNDCAAAAASSIDPCVEDPQEARATAIEATFRIERLTASLEALRNRYHEAVAAERYEQWRQTLALPALQARDEAATALMSAYENALAILLPALRAAAIADEKIKFCNSQIDSRHWPTGYLASVEVHARQLPGPIGWGCQNTIMGLKLPVFPIGEFGLQNYWPPIQPPQLEPPFTYAGAPLAADLTPLPAPVVNGPAEGDNRPWYQIENERNAAQQSALVAGDFAKREQSAKEREAEQKRFHDEELRLRNLASLGRLS